MSGPLWTSLPEGWRSAQMKNAATVTLGKMLQGKDSGQDVSAPYLRAANVQPDGVLAVDDWKEMWFDSTELERLSIHRGDVVVVEGGQGGFGRAAFVRTDLGGWGFQNSINRLRPVAGADGRFLAYYLIALRASGYIHAYANVVSMPHLTADKLERLSVPLPPAESQRAIANYLDRETARIDTLIEEQQRLIEMLRGRRKAVVERAVFCGLDDAPSTGNPEPWLPDTPAHWPVVQLGFLSDTLAGYAFSSDGFSAHEDQVRLLRGVNVKPGAVDWSDVVYWDTQTQPVPVEYSLSAGDLVFGMDRPFVGAGVRVAPVADDDLPALLLQRVMRIRSNAGADSAYLRYAVATDAFLDYLEPLFTGVSVPHVSEWQVRKFKMPCPPLDEQERIAEYLDLQTAKIDELIHESERFIELSRERRAALITAAVTGQIDVREVA
ncbi:restriction endonuclease subunit S [Janibacter hoylei]